jgi:hypothetical protein
MLAFKLGSSSLYWRMFFRYSTKIKSTLVFVAVLFWGHTHSFYVGKPGNAQTLRLG